MTNNRNRSVHEKAALIMREVYLRSLEDDAPDGERDGIITRRRFELAAKSATGFRDRGTLAGYWGDMQDLGIMTVVTKEVNGMSIKDWDRARVRADIWQRGGRIVDQMAQARELVKQPTNVSSMLSSEVVE